MMYRMCAGVTKTVITVTSAGNWMVSLLSGAMLAGKLVVAKYGQILIHMKLN